MSYIETIVVLVDTSDREVETPLGEPDLSVSEALEQAQALAQQHQMTLRRIRQVRKRETWLDTLVEGIGSAALVAMVLLAL